MKDDKNIDELLNGFIDDELSLRRRTEVQRLLSHDPQVEKRMNELKRCRELVGCLPLAKAPDDTLEHIQAVLERRTLLGQHPEHIEERLGARHLLFRKLLTTAAMLGLVAVLGGVVYHIISPGPLANEPLAVEYSAEPAEKIQTTEPAPALVAVEQKSAEAIASSAFKGTLELKTSTPKIVEAIINRAIAANAIDASMSGPDTGVYVLSCTRQTLGRLLADLEDIWPKFDSAKLLIASADGSEHLAVAGVNTHQILQIAAQDSPENRVKVARDFTILNNMAEQLAANGAIAGINEDPAGLKTIPDRIPKPVLTSNDNTSRKTADHADSEKVQLTILVIDSE